jgi:predicted PurR-regulated permease PerM
MNTTRDESVKTAIEISIKLGALAIVLFVSFLIVKPFIAIIVWSIILAVALSPMIQKLASKLQIKKTKLLTLISIVAVLALTLPTYMLSDRAVDSITALSEVVKEGSFEIPPPNEKVKEWPLIGKKSYALWESASENLTQTLAPFEDDIKTIAKKMISAIGGVLSMIIFSVVAVIIAAFLIKDEDKYVRIYKNILTRLIGEKGEEWANLSALTIRSVATGIIGVAFIQAIAILPALLIMDVPFAILIAVAVMFLTIVQLPPTIIIAPVIAYVFSYADGTGATIFAIYTLLVGASDSLLKPLLMGRGVDIPMLVILIGAIGGMLLMGMIGLFVGAVIFALAYKLFKLWIAEVEAAN